MATPIPPSDHKISLEQAVQYVDRYRDSKPAQPTPTFVFDRKAFDRVLGQADCVGVRMYPAANADGQQVVVIVGVDSKGNDMAQGELSEDPFYCPPYCEPDSPFMAAT